MNKKIFVAAAALFGVNAMDASAQSYDKMSFEIRGTSVVPTFDIADVANVGWGGGVGLGYLASDKVRLMADFDFGAHGTDTPDVTINTYHYMAKVGYEVFSSDKVTFSVNLGAGAVTFGGDLPDSYTYPAINAGAKLGIQLSPSVDFLISPQGDIAFSDEAEVGTSNSWVWPFGVGLRIKY
jgi:hypothetical protein